MKFGKALLLFTIISSSCHDAQLQQINPNQKEDHDTMESIKKSNLAIIQGSWAMEREGKTVYIEILDAEYNILIRNGDIIELSDHGRTLHTWPGTVRLFSSVEGCSASKKHNVYMNFQVNNFGDVVTNGNNRSAVALNRTQRLTDLPPANLCLWDYDEPNKVRLSEGDSSNTTDLNEVFGVSDSSEF